MTIQSTVWRSHITITIIIIAHVVCVQYFCRVRWLWTVDHQKFKYCLVPILGCKMHWCVTLAIAVRQNVRSIIIHTMQLPPYNSCMWALCTHAYCSSYSTAQLVTMVIWQLRKVRPLKSTVYMRASCDKCRHCWWCRFGYHSLSSAA